MKKSGSFNGVNVLKFITFIINLINLTLICIQERTQI